MACLDNIGDAATSRSGRTVRALAADKARGDRGHLLVTLAVVLLTILCFALSGCSAEQDTVRAIERVHDSSRSWRDGWRELRKHARLVPLAGADQQKVADLEDVLDRRTDALVNVAAEGVERARGAR